MEEESYCVPPGFRFHPTEEELVGYYLARKVVQQQQQAAAVDGIIQEVDLYSIEPWDLQARCCWQQQQQQQEYCYFFSYKDRKYPSGTGTRTNRATAAGFWKATGRDKPVLSTSSSQSAAVIGMRKTLVFHRGRAPNGSKTDWIIHEYRLVADHHQQERWVVCRAFQKPTTTTTLLQRPPSSSSFFPAANTYARAPSLLHQLHPGYCGQYPPPVAAAAGDAAGLLCSSNLLELEDDDEESKMMILSKIPRLVSPTAVKTSGAGDINVTTALAAADHHRHPELLLAVMQQQQQTCPIDWNLLDTLLHDSAAASTSLLY